jgi:hypothetical protein
MSNKLGTLGYFKKRMRDCGYVVDDLWRYYSKTDPRLWSVVIDPGCSTVFCTYYQNVSEPGDNYFEIYDGGQYIPSRFKIKTSSIETFVEYLNRFGIINKSTSYNKEGHREDERTEENMHHSNGVGPADVFDKEKEEPITEPTEKVVAESKT